MRVLLDECLPRHLAADLPGHEVMTVPAMGWAGVKDASLLRLADGRFDVFITADQNLEYQQRLDSTSLAIIVLATPNTRLNTLRPLVPQVLAALATLRPGDLVRVASA